MGDPIGVALVGYGYAGATFHAPLIGSVPGLALRCVVSGDPAKVRARHPGMRVVDGLEGALADSSVELVVIATPNPLHAPLAGAALAAGRHVVVDKPFTLTLAEALALAERAEAAGRVLAVFQNRRWDADFLTLCRLIGEGRLGEIVQFDSHFDRYRPKPRDRWRERAEPGGGLWYDLGPHLADQALCLFGMPEAVEADLAALRPGAAVDDYFHVQLRYPRRRVILHGSCVAAGTPRFAVHGMAASFVKHGLDAQEARLKAGETPQGADWGRDPNPGTLITMKDDVAEAERVAGEPGDYRRFYLGMEEAIRGAAPNPVPPREAVAVMAVIEAALDSARSSRPVVPRAGGDLPGGI